LYLGIAVPIPDGMMGLIEFNRLEALKQMLVEFQQSGKDVAGELNSPGTVMKIRDPELKACCLTPLMAAAYLGHAELVTVLVKTGAIVNQTTSGLTAVMLAALQGHTDIALALIQADAKAHPAGPVDWTALLYAAANGRAITVKALLDAGANPWIRNTLGHSALSLAKQRNHEEIIKRRRAYGAIS
jgi:hypothetical protein